jgi:hypothetical protein
VRGPRSWCYGRTAALRLIVQPLWWRWRWPVFLPSFTSNGAPVVWNWQGKTDNSEKNLSQCHFVHHKSHMDLTWYRTPGLRGERPATNRLSHGTAELVNIVSDVLIVAVDWHSIGPSQTSGGNKACGLLCVHAVASEPNTHTHTHIHTHTHTYTHCGCCCFWMTGPVRILTHSTLWYARTQLKVSSHACFVYSIDTCDTSAHFSVL